MSHSQNKILVVFIDAFGPEQLEYFAEHFPFLQHHGQLQGVLGYSSGALPTILTGAPPAVHGRMCLFSHAESDQASVLRPLRWLGLLPRVIHERRRVRRAVERVLTRAQRLSGYVALHRVPPELFEWLDIPERDDMFTSHDIGGAPTFLSEARRAGLSVYAAPWQTPEPLRWQEAHRALAATKPDLAFLYATELDGVMHHEGPNGEAARTVIERIARNIQRARELMAEDGSTLTTLVVGDHGMAAVDTFVNPTHLLRQLPNCRVFVDSTMLRAWGNERQLSQVRLAIEREAWPGTWMQQDALRQRSVPVERPIYGNAMFVLDQGAIFSPSFLGGAVKGMHGYDITTSSAYAALASDTPVDPGMTSLLSIAPVVKRQLGLVT